MDYKSNIHFFLHFGTGRAGTTFLQGEIFKKLNDFKIIIDKDDEILLLIRKIINDKFINNNDIVRIRNLIKSSGYKKILISDETICYQLLKYNDCKKLSKLFHKCNILITIRSQIKSLESYYIESKNNKNYFLSFDDYLENILNNYFENDLEKFFFESLKYEKIYYLLKPLSNNISILPYECLINYKEEYLNILDNFLEIQIDKNKINFKNKINRRKSAKWYFYEKIRSRLPIKRNFISNYLNNKIRFKVNQFFKKGKPAKININENMKKKLLNYFEKNNKRVESIAKINLKKLNYFSK